MVWGDYQTSLATPSCLWTQRLQLPSRRIPALASRANSPEKDRRSQVSDRYEQKNLNVFKHVWLHYQKCRQVFFSFYAGLLRELFPAVECKVATMGPQELHCVLLMDEMQLTPGLQYDCTTKTVIGQTTLKGCKLPSNDGIVTFATHGLVFMLAGLSTRWKQVIGYHFTGKCVNLR